MTAFGEWLHDHLCPVCLLVRRDLARAAGATSSVPVDSRLVPVPSYLRPTHTMPGGQLARTIDSIGRAETASTFSATSPRSSQTAERVDGASGHQPESSGAALSSVTPDGVPAAPPSPTGGGVRVFFPRDPDPRPTAEAGR